MSREKKKYIRKIFGLTILSFFAIFFSIITSLFYVFQIEPNWIQVKHINVTLPNLDPEFNNWKLVEISDIHVNSWMTKKRLDKVVQLVNKKNPEIITITGDFLNKDTEYFNNIFKSILRSFIPFIPINNQNKILKL